LLARLSGNFACSTILPLGLIEMRDKSVVRDGNRFKYGQLFESSWLVISDQSKCCWGRLVACCGLLIASSFHPMTRLRMEALVVHISEAAETRGCAIEIAPRPKSGQRITSSCIIRTPDKARLIEEIAARRWMSSARNRLCDLSPWD
jgi:hypothetical protein